MSALKAKMHQNRFRLEIRHGPRWGAYSVPQDIIGGFKGLLLSGGYGRGEKERRGEAPALRWYALLLEWLIPS